MKVFNFIIVVLLVAITILMHTIEGVNLIAYYSLFIPLIVIRLIRTNLLVKW
jgi:hypothetical protein